MSVPQWRPIRTGPERKFLTQGPIAVPRPRGWVVPPASACATLGGGGGRSGPDWRQESCAGSSGAAGKKYHIRFAQKKEHIRNHLVRAQFICIASNICREFDSVLLGVLNMGPPVGCGATQGDGVAKKTSEILID